MGCPGGSWVVTGLDNLDDVIKIETGHESGHRCHQVDEGSEEADAGENLGNGFEPGPGECRQESNHHFDRHEN